MVSSPPETALRIGFVMVHTSPLDVPGTKDAGGMNVVVRAQAEALSRAGHDVRIYTRRTDPAVAKQCDLTSGVRVIHLDAGPARLLSKGEHEGVIDEFRARLADELTADPVDLVHAEHWFSGIAALPVARSLGVPLVQSYHSIAAPPNTPLGAGERPESPGRLSGEQLLAHEADLIVAVSQAERQTVLDRLGGDASRVSVVPLGVDTELFHPAAPEEDDEDYDWLVCGGRPEAIVVGRLHPLKGFDLAIAAVAALPASERPMLRIVGAAPPDGEDYARSLHEAVASAGMLATTSFDGPLRRRDLAERIRRASLMLVPSHSETFGLVALEAAASGVPVIARAAGGLREAVVDGVTGVLLDSEEGSANEADEWAAAIAALLADGDRRASLARAAREHALQRTWAASAEALLCAYRAVLGRRSA